MYVLFFNILEDSDVTEDNFHFNLQLPLSDLPTLFRFRGVERNVLGALNGVTGPEGHEISKDLAQESLQIADRRADLGKKLERLEVAHKVSLYNFKCIQKILVPFTTKQLFVKVSMSIRDGYSNPNGT